MTRFEEVQGYFCVSAKRRVQCNSVCIANYVWLYKVYINGNEPAAGCGMLRRTFLFATVLGSPAWHRRRQSKGSARRVFDDTALPLEDQQKGVAPPESVVIAKNKQLRLSG